MNFQQTSFWCKFIGFYLLTCFVAHGLTVKPAEAETKPAEAETKPAEAETKPNVVFILAEARWFNPRVGTFEGAIETLDAGDWIDPGIPPSAPEEDWVFLLRSNSPQ